MVMPRSSLKKFKIFFIGKFSKMHDEEYIARSFESIGCEVFRCPENHTPAEIKEALVRLSPDMLLYTKWECPRELDETISLLKRGGMVTVCWVFDLYWGYPREYQVHNKKFFRSDFVFTTDGGHDEQWRAVGINHRTIRQGIYKEECFLAPGQGFENDVVFVGSESPVYPERTNKVLLISQTFRRFAWYGRHDTDEARGTRLNEIFAQSKVVVGDSYPSPHYWSNRIVETLGRGGFLIHRDVEGLKKEYPYLVTYNGTDGDLINKVKYYIEHDKEREEIRQANFEWVRDNYTMDKKCQELLNYIS